MPRGVEYAQDNQVSDNTFEAAPMPEVTGSSAPYSGQGHYSNLHGSGKGGHEPNTLGENKGVGAQGV
ncbi:hypothetical protein BDW60DRAFT_206294 [Aspergillus nidulans var. acristatus]